MRLIDADALDNALTALRFNADGELAHWGDRKDWCLHGSEIEKMIANAPTVDAEPVRHGRWFKTYDDEGEAWMCSECCEEWGFDEGHPKDVYGCNYCPNCGAKMDQEDSE